MTVVIKAAHQMSYMTSFICSVSESTRDGSGNTDSLSQLNQLPPSLKAKSLTDTGKIHSAPPTKIQTDSQNLFSELINVL